MQAAYHTLPGPPPRALADNLNPLVPHMFDDENSPTVPALRQLQANIARLYGDKPTSTEGVCATVALRAARAAISQNRVPFAAAEAADMFSTGYIAAVEASKRYDPARGTPLSAFLYPRALGAIQTAAWREAVIVGKVRRYADDEATLTVSIDDTPVDIGSTTFDAAGLYPDEARVASESALRQGLRQLPRADAKLLSQAYGIDHVRLTQAQLAVKHGVTQGAISLRVARARERLRTITGEL